MITKLEQSSGNVIGFKVSGTITKDDYATLVPDVEALVDQVGDINVLLDLTDFKWEKVNAWGSDMKFGSTYRKKIDKMAIVGDKTWQKWLTHLVDPFYAREAQFFSPQDSESAWTWLADD